MLISIILIINISLIQFRNLTNTQTKETGIITGIVIKETAMDELINSLLLSKIVSQSRRQIQTTKYLPKKQKIQPTKSIIIKRDKKKISFNGKLLKVSIVFLP